MYKAAVCVSIDNIYSICGLGCEAAIVWHHCKWHLTDKRRKRSRASRHIHCCTVALSNVQKSIVSRNPCNTVVKLRLYTLEYVSYSVWSKRIGRKGRNPKNAKEVIYTLEPFHLEEWLAFVRVQSALYTLFYSLMLHSVARMLAAVIHCITVYKQPSPSLHRQHYCAIWCVDVMSCTLSCLPARALPSNRHHTCSLTSPSNLWPPCLHCTSSRKGCGSFLWIAAATEHLALATGRHITRNRNT